MDKSIVVSTIGLGYIGLPTSALIASNKIKVNGIIDEKIFYSFYFVLSAKLLFR